ncbi:MAG: tryptophan synthase subunit alpha, partial [Candidatus Eremiobacteraeota bacterium]|nr:tryptophan synthase subunit alpha [Candidatus Eremiobacteraeota bacterium]
AMLRKFTSKPLAVGFGVATAQDAQPIADIADGVVVGSALMRAAQGSEPARAVEGLCAALARACVRISSPA